MNKIIAAIFIVLASLCGEGALEFLDQASANPDPNGGAGYSGNRTVLFGKAWTDVDKNGCDTRNDILARDLHDITYRKPGDSGTSTCPKATVDSGTLEDPYTGKTIHFQRGPKSAEVQIDHVIPLAYAYRNGLFEAAQAGRKAEMVAFANDPDNLLAVDGPANGQKSDQGPAAWMPPNEDFHCQYALRFVQVAQKYEDLGLGLPEEDRTALAHTITTKCQQGESVDEQHSWTDSAFLIGAFTGVGAFAFIALRRWLTGSL